MKKILAVNVDAFNLNIISSMLTEHTSDFEFLTTKKIKEIDDIIRKLATDIVIIDLESPTPQDLKILAGISKAYPRLPLLVMTAFETGEIESAIKAIGTLRYFEKPVDLKEIVDLIWGKIERSVSGEVHGISLTSFLQMSEMERTSCTLKIKAGDKVGTLFLIKGALIAAETGVLQNEDAVLEILSWDNPAIEIDDTPVNRKKEIQTPLISLLMESVRRKDEKKKPAPKKAAAKKQAPKGTAAPDAPKTGKGKAAPAEEAVDESAAAAAEAPEGLPEGEDVQASAKITDASKALKQKQMIKQAVMAIIAVVVLATALCLWQFVYRPWQAGNKFNQVAAQVAADQPVKKKIEILDAFLASHPPRQYAVKAENIKRTYADQLEAEEFDRVLKEINELPLDDNFQAAARQKCLDFLEQFPETGYKDEINSRIENIPVMMDDAEYARLKKVPKNHYSQRLMAYQAYLTRHPDSANAGNVKKMLNDLGQAFYNHIKTQKAACDEEQSWLKCIKLGEYFLDNFKTHERAGEVSALLRDMTARAAFAKIVEEVEGAGSLSQEAATLLEDYLEDYPDSPLRETAQERLSQIKNTADREKTWRDIVNFVKNDQNSIFDRVDRMAGYLNRPSPVNHKEEAENIYAWLLKEKERTQRQLNQKAEAEKRRQQQEVVIAREKKRIVRQIEQSGGRYTIESEGTVTDHQTGLTWCMLDSLILSNKCMDYKTAKQYVSDMTTGGYNDWRLPDPNELLVLYNSKPTFPLTDAEWYWTSEAFYAAWEEKVNTVVRTDSGIWHKAETNLEKCGAVRAVRP